MCRCSGAGAGAGGGEGRNVSDKEAVSVALAEKGHLVKFRIICCCCTRNPKSSNHRPDFNEKHTSSSATMETRKGSGTFVVSSELKEKVISMIMHGFADCWPKSF